MKKTKKLTKKSVRLVPHIKPTRYNLTLKPDLEAFTFAGQEVIDIVIDKTTKEITLHSKDISIETVEIIQNKKSEFGVIKYDTEAETATFYFKNNLTRGKAKLSIVFSGIINNSLRGFYKSTYQIDGITKHIATTQFEATDARRAFPCFDEPAQKATFDVSLIVPGTHTAISNTLPKSIKEHEDGYKVVSFAPTPIMSTYLLAFIIGDFEFIEGKTKDNVQVRVFTTKGKKHQAKFALDVAIRSLEFYNDYFAIPYPLPILDMIAIPDFESGAMENWGAVTYRETALLIDEEHSALSSKQRVALVVAHELAHQWFGNLVTMHWWTDLWLNEGFASYIEYLAVDHIFPEWRMWNQFITSDMAAALRLDALENSHPIEVVVHHPNEINEIFDMISYAKGASVIRMLASYLGEDTFKRGLQQYLRKHSYKNTTTLDLWQSLEKVSKKPVSKLMHTWTKKTGYPLLSIHKKNNVYTVSQERFFSSRIAAKNNTERTLWPIPFKYESNKEILHSLLTKKSSPLVGTLIGKLNTGEQSLVRTRYDRDTLSALQKNIEKGTVSIYDRLGIIRDVFALAEGGYIPTTDALDFALSYKKEKEYVVWAEIAAGINRVYNIIANEPDSALYKIYACSIFSPLAEEVGWHKKNGESDSYTFLRSLALAQAGFYGDKKVIKYAQKLFADRTHHTIAPDIRGIVYNIVASYGRAREWKQFQKLYKEEKLQEEQSRYGRALGQFQDPKLIKQTLAFALSKDVRTQDAAFIIGTQWYNVNGHDLTWKFIKDNWATILERYGGGGHFLGRLLEPLASHTYAKDAIDAKKFFKKNPAPGATRTLEQAYERIYSNDAWRKADKTSIKKWLNQNFKK